MTPPLWTHQQNDIERYLRDGSLFNTSDPGCVSADTEFLTPTGWKRIDEYDNELVAQFHPRTKEISFVRPLAYVKKPCDEFYHINPARGTSQVLSAEHNVLYYTNDGSFHKCSMEDYYNWHISVSSGARHAAFRKFETTYSVVGTPGVALTDAELRVMVMVIADGHFPYKNNTCVVRVKKERKKQRAKQLLRAANIPFKLVEYRCDPEYIRIFFSPPRKEKEFSPDWWDCTQSQLEIIADEAKYWDSSIDPRPSAGVRFSSYVKASAEFIQHAFCAAKQPAYLRIQVRERRSNVEKEFCVQARGSHQLIGPGRNNSIKIIPSLDGFKYCFEVPTGCLMLRHNGYTFATGNTGKTRTVIEVIRQRKLPTLILAPKSILQCAWGNDIETFAPELTYSIATASNRAAMMSTDSLIKITNIDALLWLKENPRYMRQFEGGMLVIDESTSVKNPQSRRSKAAMHFRPMFEYATCMSGTPSPQGVIDLWSQMYLVDQGQRLGKSFSRFRNFAYTPVRKGAFLEWVEKQGAADMVAGLIADITIRNKREDCLDLPPNQVIRYNTTLSAKHAKQYEALKKNALLELQTGEITAIHAGVLLQKLLQIATGAVYDTEGNYHVVDDARYDLIMDLVEERPHSVVVFNWRHQREQLVEAAKKRKIPCDYIDGSVTSAARRAEIVAKYQAGDYQTLFIHPQSAGHGITLTKGHATIWASPTYNAEWFEQANARIYRGGQDKETETILISATGTAEPLVYQALQEKCGNMKDLLATFI